MAKLRAPQTGHRILQILAEVKDILHGPLPLGFGVCGSAMQNTKVIKHFDYQNKTRIQSAVLLWPVLVVLGKSMHTHFSSTCVCSWLHYSCLD